MLSDLVLSDLVLSDLVLLAAESEGVPGDHIAATIVPIVGAIFFCGSIYVLLWSIYGAKKGALVYGTAFFAFAMVVGIFWWFGAPGTPVATGLKYFPYQPTDQYQAKWYAMEPGSERAEHFEATRGGREELAPEFQTPAEFVGMPDAPQDELEENDRYRALSGALEAGTERMLEIYVPESETGTVLIGQERRARLSEEAPPPEEDERADTPFFQGQVATEGEGDDAREAVYVTEEDGVRVAAARLQVTANYVPADPDAPPIPRPVVVEEAYYYAFQDPGALWFPSAVWTGIAGILFLGCLAGLDRVEQREKTRVLEREPISA